MGVVYVIKNTTNDKLYVGSTIDEKARKKQHFSDLRCDRHYNRHLQSAFNKYGESSFEWQVLEEVDDAQLADQEKFWIDQLNATNQEFGYNATGEPYAPMRGRKHSAEVRLKMSLDRTGCKHPSSKLSEADIERVFSLYQFRSRKPLRRSRWVVG